MLEAINQFIVRCSFSKVKFAALFIGFFGSLRALLFIGETFKVHANGAVPFDLQNELTSEQIFAQLANYADEAYTLYYVFTAIDYAFPLLAGLFLATIWAFVLCHCLPSWYEKFLQHNLFLLLLIPTVFDWMENVTLLTVILAYPEPLYGVAEAAVIAKKIKLATTVTAQASTLLILLTGAVIWLRRRFSR